MAKAVKQDKPSTKQLADVVTIDTDFHGAMKLLAHHANTKGTKKITYKGRTKKAE